MNHALPVALVSLLGSLLVASLTSACAHETQERPATATAAAPTPSPPPLPDSAFRSDEESARPPSPSRFDTRRLGVSGVSDDDADDAEGDTSGSRRFHGAPVDLDLKSADLANVFRLLADVGHVDIVIAGEVSGTVTLRLKHVPWDQALELVARTHGLGLHQEGNVIVVRAGEPQRVSSTIR